MTLNSRLLCVASVCALSHVASAGTISAVKHGAIVDDGKDDTLAIAAAINECEANPGSTLVLPKGQLDFFAGANPKHRGQGMVFNKCERTKVIGDQTLFMFHGDASCVLLNQCKDFHIEGITIDFVRPSFSIGDIIAAKDKTFDVQVWKEYPVKGGEPVQAFMDYDPKTKLPRKHGLDVYYGVEKTELIAPQVLRVHTKEKQKVELGKWVVLRHKAYGHYAFWCNKCDGVTVKDVTIYTVPGMGLVGQNSKDITMDGVRMVPKPGTNRLISATADGCHFKHCTGTITIKNCVFDGTGDDGGNIGGLYLTVMEQPDNRTVVVQHSMKHHITPEAGDVLEFADNETLLPYATSKIESAKWDNKTKMCTIVFDKPLPETLKLGHVLANATRTPKVRISNCTVRNNRARGFLIQTRDAIVENCKFENCTSGGVWAMCEIVFFNESISTQNITIRNCVFDNCGYAGPIGEGVLSVYSYLKDFAYPPKPGVHRDIVLENNIIRGADNCGIFIAGADNLKLSDTVVEDCSRTPTRGMGHAAVYIMSSRNVSISNLTVDKDKQGEGCKAAIEYGPGNEMDTFKTE